MACYPYVRGRFYESSYSAGVIERNGATIVHYELNIIQQKILESKVVPKQKRGHGGHRMYYINQRCIIRALAIVRTLCPIQRLVCKIILKLSRKHSKHSRTEEIKFQCVADLAQLT